MKKYTSYFGNVGSLRGEAPHNLRGVWGAADPQWGVWGAKPPSVRGVWGAEPPTNAPEALAGGSRTPWAWWSRTNKIDFFRKTIFFTIGVEI